MSVLSYKLYAFCSMLAFGCAIINSYSLHEEFYPTVIHLTSSKANKLVILNFLFMIVFSVCKVIVHFTFGEIREMEKINIIDKMKRKCVDLALLFIYFNDDALDMTFFVTILIIIGLMLLHWLAQARSEYLVTDSSLILRPHLKLILFFVLLFGVDYWMLFKIYASQQYVQSKRVMMQLFAFEVLMNIMRILHPFAKYVVSVFELFTLSHFENKTSIFQLLDFVFTTAKLLLRLHTVRIIHETFNLPLYLLSDVLEDIFRLYQTCRNFFKSIKLIYQLQQLEDVTDQDLRDIDQTCLICLQDMHSGKKINCGHIFHFGCLKTWLQGAINQFCPKCKEPLNLDEAVRALRHSKMTGTHAAHHHHNRYQPMRDLRHEQFNETLHKIFRPAENAQPKGVPADYHHHHQATSSQPSTVFSVHHSAQPKRTDESVDERHKVITAQATKALDFSGIYVQEVPAVKYGLPKEALYDRTDNHQNLKRKVEIMNDFMQLLHGNPHLQHVLVPLELQQILSEKFRIDEQIAAAHVHQQQHQQHSQQAPSAEKHKHEVVNDDKNIPPQAAVEEPMSAVIPSSHHHHHHHLLQSGPKNEMMHSKSHDPTSTRDESAGQRVRDDKGLTDSEIRRRVWLSRFGQLDSDNEDGAHAKKKVQASHSDDEGDIKKSQ